MLKINQQQAQEIIDKYVSGDSSYKLADEYGIWQTSVCNIIGGRTWEECIRPNNIKRVIASRDKRKGLICKEIPPLTSFQEDIIVGSLLGDGTFHNLTSIRTNSNFSKVQRYDRKSYLDWHFLTMGEYSARVSPVYSSEKLTKTKEGKIHRKKDEKRLSGFCFRTFRHPNLTKFRNEWYPKGIKQIPISLELNPRRIAIWYFDDGSNDAKHRVAVICTQSFTVKEVEFLMEKLKPFNLFPKIETTKSKITDRVMPHLKFTRDSYDNLIHLVGPYMLWDCFAYKIAWHRAQKQWEYSSLFTEEQARHIIELRKTKSARQIAQQFNVHVNNIYSLVSGRTWKHLPR